MVARGIQKGLYGPTQGISEGCNTAGVIGIFAVALIIAYAAAGIEGLCYGILGLLVGFAILAVLVALAN